MINPFINERGVEELPQGPRGKGLRRLRGDEDLRLRSLPGDIEPFIGASPSEFRPAGSKIKGLAQLDPTLYAKLFP
jgi:hypothetical protein